MQLNRLPLEVAVVCVFSSQGLYCAKGEITLIISLDARHAYPTHCITASQHNDIHLF